MIYVFEQQKMPLEPYLSLTQDWVMVQPHNNLLTTRGTHTKQAATMFERKNVLQHQNT